MTDRYDALERIQRLHDTGALTEKEFASEKQRILAKADEPEVSERIRRFDWRIGAAIAGLLLVVGIAAWLGLTSTLRDTDSSGAKRVVASTEQPADAALQNPPLASLSHAEQLRLAAIAAFGTSGQQVVKTSDETKITKPIRLMRLAFGPVLLTTTEIKDGCHACVGAVGVFYLSEENGAFKVVKRWPKAVQGWGWGAPPTDWNVTEKFTAYPAIFAEGGFTGQGITCSSASITELRPDGPRQSDLILTGYTNEGAVLEDGTTGGGEPLRSLEGKIVNIMKAKSFEVKVSGTENFSERYTFRGGKYGLASGQSQLEC